MVRWGMGVKIGRNVAGIRCTGSPDLMSSDGDALVREVMLTRGSEASGFQRIGKRGEGGSAR